MKLPCHCKLIKSVYIPSPDCKHGAGVSMNELIDMQQCVWYGAKYFIMKFGASTPLNKPDENAMKVLADPNTKIVLVVQHHLISSDIYYHEDQIYRSARKPMFTETNTTGYEIMTIIPRRGYRAMPFNTRKSLLSYVNQAFAGQQA